MKIYNFYSAKRNGRLDRVKSRAIEERIREKYSVSDELTIIRRMLSQLLPKNTRNEEYQEYFDFVDSVTNDVNEETAYCIEHKGKVKAEVRKAGFKE
ncbi:MAG: hypothetical protein IJ002_03185 [Clostridia bacterium]|nr:hypothetical protein [Clostridia bacterium]MBQ8836496.1 hypothetical protein [Clostridia bacterium]